MQIRFGRGAGSTSFVNLDAVQQVTWRDVEGLGELEDGDESGILVAAFQGADVVRMRPCRLRQALSRPSEQRPARSKPATELDRSNRTFATWGHAKTVQTTFRPPCHM